MSQAILLHQTQVKQQSPLPCIAGKSHSPFGCLAIRVTLEPDREYTFLIPRWFAHAALLLAHIVPTLRVQVRQNKLRLSQLRQLLRDSARPGQILSLDLRSRNGAIIRVNDTDLAGIQDIVQERSGRAVKKALRVERQSPTQIAPFGPFLQRLDR